MRNHNSHEASVEKTEEPTRRVIWGTHTENTDVLYNSDDTLKSLWLQHLQREGTIQMALQVQYPSHKYQISFRWESLNEDVQYFSRSFESTRRQQKQCDQKKIQTTNRAGFAVRQVVPGTHSHSLQNA